MLGKKSSSDLIHRLSSKILDLFFPPQCLICGRLICGRLICDQSLVGCEISAKYSGHPLCIDCERSLSNNTIQFGNSIDTQSHCVVCHEQSPELYLTGRTCLPCLLYPLGVHQLRSLFYFNNQTEVAVKKLKYGGKLPIAQLFAQLLADSLASLFVSCAWDLIIPIPSAISSVKQRGYSHSAMIAKALGERVGIKVDLFALRSSRPRYLQAELPLSKRFNNLHNAFSVDQKKVTEKRVLLIDDMLTTGATLYSAAKTLNLANAISIDALTVARSQRFQLNRIAARCSTKLQGNRV